MLQIAFPGVRSPLDTFISLSIPITAYTGLYQVLFGFNRDITRMASTLLFATGLMIHGTYDAAQQKSSGLPQIGTGAAILFASLWKEFPAIERIRKAHLCKEALIREQFYEQGRCFVSSPLWRLARMETDGSMSLCTASGTNSTAPQGPMTAFKTLKEARCT